MLQRPKDNSKTKRKQCNEKFRKIKEKIKGAFQICVLEMQNEYKG